MIYEVCYDVSWGQYIVYDDGGTVRQWLQHNINTRSLLPCWLSSASVLVLSVRFTPLSLYEDEDNADAWILILGERTLALALISSVIKQYTNKKKCLK